MNLLHVRSSELGLGRKAERMFNRAKKLFLKGACYNDHWRGVISINLAYSKELQGSIVEAERLYLESITYHKRDLKLDSLDESISFPCNNLARLYVRLNKGLNAEELLKMAVSAYEVTFGANDIMMFKPLYALAEFYGKFGLTDARLAVLEQATTICNEAGRLHVNGSIWMSHEIELVKEDRLLYSYVYHESAI